MQVGARCPSKLGTYPHVDMRRESYFLEGLHSKEMTLRSLKDSLS